MVLADHVNTWVRVTIYLQLMRDEDDGLLAQVLPDGIVEDVIAHMGVQGTERVIQDVDGAVAVEGSRQADALPLPTAKVGATLTNLK